jgi:predicted nucleic acid-binding protein
VTYFDTSVLVAFYANERSALEAARSLASSHHPAPFNPILELELRNAIRRKLPRREATPTQVRGFLRQLVSDLAQGILAWQVFDFDRVFDRAETLGTRFTEQLNTRSFDILHVSIAIETGCDAFHTFDHDQRRLAAAAGLTTNPITR